MQEMRSLERNTNSLVKSITDRTNVLRITGQRLLAPLPFDRAR